MNDQQMPRPLFTPEAAAAFLCMPVEAIRFLAATRRLSALHVGSQLRFTPDEVERASPNREALLRDYNIQAADDWRLRAFEGGDLSPVEIAAFFGVSEAEVRSVLDFSWDVTTSKQGLWTLIVAGRELDTTALTQIEERLDRVRQHRTIVPRAVRLAVRARDQDRCRYCGRQQRARAIHLDHVLPKKRGGADTPSNLVVACIRCNSHKRDRLPHEAGLRLLSPATLILNQRRRRTYEVLDPPGEPYEVLVEGPVSNFLQHQ